MLVVACATNSTDIAKQVLNKKKHQDGILMTPAFHVQPGRMGLWDGGYVRLFLNFNKHGQVLSWQMSMMLL